jgi:hypothetical protein
VRLEVTASPRFWDTPGGTADFLTSGTVRVLRFADKDVLILTTIRSREQYNTTMCLDDRYCAASGP